jgi:hypothetical protein
MSFTSDNSQQVFSPSREEFVVRVTVIPERPVVLAYTPIAEILRTADDEYPIATLTTNSIYRDEHEAYEAGLERAKAWIHEHPFGLL